MKDPSRAPHGARDDHPLRCYLARHYRAHPHHFRTLRDILERKPQHISLRNLDYFVTNLAKRIVVPLPSTGQDLHQAYKQQLVRFSKVHFDVFQRRARTTLAPPPAEPPGTPPLVTTLGQLNFFRWAFENGVLQAMESYADVVRDELRLTNPSTPHSRAPTNTRTCPR